MKFLKQLFCKHYSIEYDKPAPTVGAAKQNPDKLWPAHCTDCGKAIMAKV